MIGVGQTAFARKSAQTLGELARAALAAALRESGGEVEAIWFGSALSRGTLAGMHALSDLVGPEVPITSIEGACATGALAAHAAACALRAGEYARVAVVGADTASRVADPVALLDAAVHERTASVVRSHLPDLALRPGSPLLIDILAARAQAEIDKRALSPRDLAAVVAQHRASGASNPDAWLRRPISIDEVLAEPTLAGPLTRSMSCALVDGAAAVVLSRGPGPVSLASMCIGGGTWRKDPHPLAALAGRALSSAQVTLSELSLLEVHDASALSALSALSGLGLGDIETVAALVSRGETAPWGSVPVNPSGGLLSKGHALGGTGVSQIVEIVRQLRGEAGPRQVAGARRALAYNGGGLVGLYDAVSAVSVWASA